MTILDYIDKLENVEQHGTWIQASCPICGGKLKISTHSHNYGSYACYTNWCHKDSAGTNHIRNLLFRPTPFRKSTVFKARQVRSSIIKQQVIRSRPFKPTSLEKYKTKVTYIPPKPVNNTLVYQYNDTFKVIRIAMPDGSKLFSYRYKTDKDSDVWDKGYPDYPVVYADRYIQTHVFVAEGEKCADALHKAGYAAIALPAAFRKQGLIHKVTDYLASQGVESCIYLRDNDKPGIKDAKIFTHSAWNSGIDCKYCNPADSFNASDVSGFDIADVNLEEIEEYLKSLFN